MNTWTYIKSDLVRYAGRYSLFLALKHYVLNRSFKYSFWFRLAKHESFFIRMIAIYKHYSLSNKYLIQIPRKTNVGFGLYIGHHMCIVIASSARLGNNINLSQFTTIGSNHNNAAVIGDNVYIGPNVNLVEGVRIGDNSTIGAGSVVTKDVPDGATVAGVPAKVISFKQPGRYVMNRFMEVHPVENFE